MKHPHPHPALASLAVALALLAGPAGAKDGNATKDEAMATVKKGVAFLKANGKDKAYAEFSN